MICEKCGGEMIETLLFKSIDSDDYLQKYECEECDESVLVPEDVSQFAK